jgi:hypothetical protein
MLMNMVSCGIFARNNSPRLQLHACHRLPLYALHDKAGRLGALSCESATTVGGHMIAGIIQAGGRSDKSRKFVPRDSDCLARCVRMGRGW